MMQQLPAMLMLHATMKAPRRPSLSAITPPLTDPNMAPMFKREANTLNKLMSPRNSEGRHILVAVVRAERGPVSPMERPKERAPQATSMVNSAVRVRVAAVMGISSPSMDGRGDALGDMLKSSWLISLCSTSSLGKLS